jgi:hypothetical protein
MVKDRQFAKWRLKQRYSDSHNAFNGIEQAPLTKSQSVPCLIVRFAGGRCRVRF